MCDMWCDGEQYDLSSMKLLDKLLQIFEIQEKIENWDFGTA